MSATLPPHQLRQWRTLSSPKSSTAITNFPTPSSRTDLRSFCGLVNQLASSTKDITTALAPLRPLLSSRNDFLWMTVHEDAFRQAKTLLTSAPTLAYFDASKETRLHTDASTLGIGFVLLQKSTDDDPEWKIVQAGSRFLSDVESRYAVIELECLAVAWSIKKCNIFLSGLPHFTVVTNHNPLSQSSTHTDWTRSKIHACSVSAPASWPITLLLNG